MLNDRTAAAIDKLYESVCEPADWGDALQNLAESLGAEGAVFTPRYLEDAMQGMAPSTNLVEPSETYIRDGWFERDFRARAWSRVGDWPVVVEHDVSTESDRRSDPYYQEFLRPLGLLWWACLPIRIGGRQWTFSLQRSAFAEPYDRAEAADLARLRPQIGIIAGLAARIRHQDMLHRLDLLEAIGKPAALIDARGSVFAVNASAEALLSADLTLTGGELRARDQESDRRLAALIASLSPGERLMERPICPPIAVRRMSGPPIIVTAVPLGRGVADLFQQASGLLVFNLPDSGPCDFGDLLSQGFGFSPAEVRLASHLVAGQTLDAAAASLSLSKETLRSQLRSIFTKTGCRRQQDLLRLLTRMEP